MNPNTILVRLIVARPFYKQLEATSIISLEDIDLARLGAPAVMQKTIAAVVDSMLAELGSDPVKALSNDKQQA